MTDSPIDPPPRDEQDADDVPGPDVQRAPVPMDPQVVDPAQAEPVGDPPGEPIPIPIAAAWAETTMPPAAPDPWAVPQRAPQRVRDNGGWLRVVIVAWCFWLLGAWAVSWLSDTSVPRVRWMLFAGSFGLMLVWPALRLGESVKPGDPVRGSFEVLLDWFSLVGVYQAVIWSLNLIANWPIERGIWLDAAVLAWSLLTALIVAAARLWPGGAARLVGMALCIALVFAEPVVLWLVMSDGGEGWSMRISPIQTLYELTRSTGSWTAKPWDERIMMVGLVAVSGWLALGVWTVSDQIITRRRAKAKRDAKADQTA